MKGQNMIYLFEARCARAFKEWFAELGEALSNSLRAGFRPGLGVPSLRELVLVKSNAKECADLVSSSAICA